MSFSQEALEEMIDEITEENERLRARVAELEALLKETVPRLHVEHVDNRHNSAVKKLRAALGEEG